MAYAYALLAADEDFRRWEELNRPGIVGDSKV